MFVTAGAKSVSWRSEDPGGFTVLRRGSARYFGLRLLYDKPAEVLFGAGALQLSLWEGQEQEHVASCWRWWLESESLTFTWTPGFRFVLSFGDKKAGFAFVLAEPEHEIINSQHLANGTQKHRNGTRLTL